jgi:hypothetical protein
MVVDGHKENWRLNSEGFKRWLRHQWHNQTNTGISSSAVTDAVETLDANATYEGTAVDVHIRIAHHAGDIFVDLCDEKWRAVRITPAGWNIIDSPPVRFVRTKGMLPLSMPTRGGSIDELRPLINAPTDEIWCLIVAWILAAFSPGPFPILLLLGEQGSAKSFLCRVLRRLIDPSEVEITTSPKDARDVIMAAQNSHVLALDNLSGIKEWLSDLLCSIATGAAHRERRYHTNNGDEELFRAKLPIVLNGIDFRVRDDLLSRAFLVTLPVIADKSRQDETKLLGLIEAATSNILGAIFDTLSSILKHRHTTVLATLPRMADAAVWVTAGESALSWAPGHFMKIHGVNRGQSAELALESDSFALALYEYMAKRRESIWIVSWRDMLDCLLPLGQHAPAYWPESGKAVATILTRLSPALRHAGINWTREREQDQRLYRFTYDVPDVAI